MVNHDDVESDAVWCAVFVIRSNSFLQSSWRSENSLTDYLKANSILGISDIDTRKLTRLIRTKGAQAASILVSVSALRFSTNSNKFLSADSC